MSKTEETTTLFIEIETELKDAMLAAIKRRGMIIRTWVAMAVREKLERDEGKG